MSFAQFILDKHFGDTSAPVKIENKPSKVVHEKKKKVKRERFVSLRHKHTALCPGVQQTEFGWMVSKTINRKTYRLGSHYDSFARARIGQKLYEYWFSVGFTVDEIPRILSDKYRQYGKRRS